MGAPDDLALPPQRPEGVVPVTIRSTVPAMQDGTLVLARIDAPSLGIECAYLFLDPQSNALGLLAPCGCAVQHPVSALVRRLADTLAEAHGDSRRPCTH